MGYYPHIALEHLPTLASHAHSDHVAGHALIKQLTGARVEVMEGDANV